jgi:hypothetical protein
VAHAVTDAWTWPVRWREAIAGMGPLRLEPDEAVRANVAKVLEAEAVPALTADVRLGPWMDGVEMSARLKATVTRTCGVTLDPFDETVDERFVLRFVPAGSPNAPPEPTGEEQEIDLEADDPPDVVAGDSIDIGAYLVEQLALALDPFPRKPDAVFEPPAADPSFSPFAALAALKAAPKEE